MKRAALFVLGLSIAITHGQTALEQQSAVPVDTCAGQARPDAEVCAQRALFDHNWPAFLKWAQLAAKGGSYLAADWLAQEYRSPARGAAPTFRQDLIRAYMWFDIAAELHARTIRALPPSADPEHRETNSQEINYRDDIARQLTPEQIAQALRLEEAWRRTELKAE